MANSFVRYVGNGSTDAYAVPFSYRAQADVAVTVDGVAVTAYTWNGAGTVITFTTAPLNLTNIEIRRTTSQTTRLVDYEDGSVLTETDLDTDSNQAFFMGQEAVDDAADKVTLDLTTFQWNAGNKRITNVADPTAAQDVITKNYLTSTYLTTATIADIALLGDVATQIGLLGVAGVITDMGILGTADVVSDMNLLGSAGTVTNMNLLGTSDAIADMNTLGTAAIVTDLDLLGTSANVTAMGLLGNATTITNMGLLGVSGVITDMGLLGTSANVTAMGLLGNSATVTDLGLLGTSAIVTDLDLLATSANVTAMGLLGTSANVTAMGLLGVSGVITDMGLLGTSAVVTDLDAVADKVTEIGRLGTADAVADLAILGTTAAVADMAILATTDVVADMNTLASADFISDLNTLATSAIVTDMDLLAVAGNITAMGLLGVSGVITNMGLLGTSGVVTNMGLLGTSAVVTDMGLLGTSAVVTDLDLLGTSANVTAMGLLGTSANVTAMSTCADNLTGINNFAARYRTGSSDPVSSLDEGDLAYNSTANTLKYYNGSAWVTIVAGSLTDIVQDGSPQLGGDLSLNGNNIDFPTTTNISDCLDEDAMGSNSATALATQQSIKAYVDAQSHSNVTASSTTTFTNKTIDANGTGNSITNLEVADLASGVLDTDLASVSGSDDTVASAKAIKTYVDSLAHLSLIDEDNMATDSATRPPSQQSVKAYADTKTTAGFAIAMAIAL